MNWTIQYSEKEPFIRVTTEETFNAPDQLKMLKDITSQDFWQPGMSVLFDNRNLDCSKSNYEVIKKASFNHKENDERIGDGKIAILVKSVTDFGLGRQYEILTADGVSAKIHVFRNEDDAVHWLSKSVH